MGFFWKHKKTAEVIKQDCYNKLPKGLKIHYSQTTEEPTHYIEESDNDTFTSMLIGAEIGSLLSDNSTSLDSGSSSTDFGSSSDNSSSFDFGGGDGGGGGADSSW